MFLLLLYGLCPALAAGGLECNAADDDGAARSVSGRVTTRQPSATC
ncbi:hypothetical protein BN132_2021 [Cronobacter turicensis 564]|nr:hypothetical protein BN132_2021 [Cronobacter turicensis 564]